MSYLKISEFFSNQITKDLDYDEEKKEIITYSIEMIFLQAFGFVLIVALASLFNALLPAAIAAIFGAFLRKLSGGAHFDSATKCLVFGAVIYTVVGVGAKNLINISFWNNNVNLLLIFISFLIVGILAPVDSKAKPIRSISFKRKLKISSLVFIAVSLLIIIVIDSLLLRTSIALGIAYQSLTLLPIFNKE
ncbi:MAG: accessory gene regulator ArgB-like protein [Peptococcaceae bacterium]